MECISNTFNLAQVSKKNVCCFEPQIANDAKHYDLFFVSGSSVCVVNNIMRNLLVISRLLVCNFVILSVRRNFLYIM